MKNLYLEFGGNYYYIDFDGLDKFLWIKDNDKEVSDTEHRTIYTAEGEPNGSEIVKKISINEKEINGVRYELITSMLQTVLDFSDGDDDDDLLGAKKALEKMPFAYKLAFNTLIKYNIIKELK
jgi:hypothetical protein